MNHRSFRLPRWWAVFLLLLIAATYRLWTPQNLVPPVPLVRLPDPLPAFFTWCPVFFLVSALLAVACFPSRLRFCWWIVAASLAAAFLLDQHRLQPWAYQSAIYATVFASVPDAVRSRRLLLPLAISVYLYSGLGKLDYQFAHSVGQDLINTATRPLGGLPEAMGSTTRAKIALLLPATELLIGFGLIFRRLRRPAGVLVIAMHVTLVVLLGPWGMNHSHGVLLWNLLLIVQAWMLFVRPVDGSSDVDAKPTEDQRLQRQEHPRRRNLFCLPAMALIAIALVAPLFERSGYWDHWLSWALYSPHSSRVDVEIHRSATDLLDRSIVPFLEPDRDEDGWHKLSLSRWSLQTLGVPVYPQARYQLGLVCEVASRYQLGDAVRGRIGGVSDRWSGRRSVRFAIGRDELKEAKDEFWLGD